MDISYEATGAGEEWFYNEHDDIRMVDVFRTKDGVTQVSVGVAEFVREEPLESKLRAVVLAAIVSVPGVEGAEEEDREVWSVDGEPSGEALVRAVGLAIGSMYEELSAFVAGRGRGDEA